LIGDEPNEYGILLQGQAGCTFGIGNFHYSFKRGQIRKCRITLRVMTNYTSVVGEYIARIYDEVKSRLLI
jgi:hypothetical protein